MRARWQAGSQGPAVSSPPDPLGLKELDGLRATSAAPPQPHREMPVPRVTCWGVGGRGLVGLRPRKLPMAIGAEPLPDRGASLLGPLQWLAQAGDEDPGVAWAALVVGGPALPPQGLRGDEPGERCLGIEPTPPRRTHSGVA